MLCCRNYNWKLVLTNTLVTISGDEFKCKIIYSNGGINIIKYASSYAIPSEYTITSSQA